MSLGTLRSGMAVALLLLAGCASLPSNPPLGQQDHDYGYRLSSWQSERGDPEFGLVVAIPGGGTRAAAFSYGILEELRRTAVPTPIGTGRLLDEVNIVTGISGGSFTALAYALYGERLFDEYDKRFLKRDVQGELFGLVLNPLKLPQMSGGSFTRSDLAADYYDRILFEGATFGDLRGRGGPFTNVAATEVTSGARVTFNQNTFDLLCSDLSAVNATGVLDQVRQTGKLNLSYRVGECPYSFATGSAPPTGFSVALCQRLADTVKTELKLPALQIEWVAVSAADRFEAVRQGRIHIDCGTDTATLQRRAVVDFSIPIALAGTGAVMRVDGKWRVPALQVARLRPAVHGQLRRA